MTTRKEKKRSQGVDGPWVELEERAHRFLSALRELGYTDESTEAEIVDRLTSTSEGLARLEDVRRIAAHVFFERQLDGDVLHDEEWKALFS